MESFMRKCIVIILWESRIDEFSLFMNFFIPFINNVKSSIKSSLFTNRLYLNRSNVFCMICPYVLRTMYIQSDLCSQINFREIVKRVLAKNKLIIYSTNEHFFTKTCIFFILSIPNIKLVRCYASHLVFVTGKKNKIFSSNFIVWK